MSLFDDDKFDRQFDRSFRLASIGAVIWILFVMAAIGTGLFIAGRALNVW